MNQAGRLASLVIVALIFGMAIMPGVLAQDFTANPGGRTIDLTPDTTIPITTTVNLANITPASQGNQGKIPLEKDALSQVMMSEAGRYVGPYVKASEFQFTSSVGGDFGFASSFNFTRQQIMSGASTYWVRWPVDALLFDSVCLEVDGFFTNPGADTYQICYGAAQPGGTAAVAFYGAANVPAYYFNVLGANSVLNLGEGAFADSTGVYLKMWSGLLPDRTYTFRFWGHLPPNTSPAMWVSIENYQTQNWTVYQWGNPLTSARQIENLTLYPAFAFNFISGIGDGGLTSFPVHFTGSTNTFIVGWPFPTYNGVLGVDAYISIYLPFSGAEDVNWHFAVETYTACGGSPIPRLDWWVNSTNNFVLTSSPMSFGTLTNGCLLTPGSDTEPLRIEFYADKPVILLGYIPQNQMVFDPNQPPVDNWGDWAFFPDITTFGAGGSTFTYGFNETLVPGRMVSRFMPVFADVEWTTGRWATVTPGTFYTTYNFGWGTAFLFPGQVQLVTFLNNGTKIFFDSRAALAGAFGGVPGASANCLAGIQNSTIPIVSDIARGMPDWAVNFVCMIVNLIGNVIGTVISVFQQIWGYLVALGQWLYTALVGAIQAIINIIMSLVEIVTQIAFSMLSVFPFIAILFVSGKILPNALEGRSSHVVRNIRRDLRARRATVRGAYRGARRARAAPGQAITAARERNIERHERRTERLKARDRRMEAKRRAGRGSASTGSKPSPPRQSQLKREDQRREEPAEETEPEFTRLGDE